MLLVSVIFVGFGFLMTSDVAAKSCEALLIDRVYHCENKISTTDSEQPLWVLEFYYATGGFRLDLTQGTFPTRTLGCQYKSTGSFDEPNFDASNWFHCASRTGSNIALAVEGHAVANGEAIIHGEAVNGNGISWVYECWRVEPD